LSLGLEPDRPQAVVARIGNDVRRRAATWAAGHTSRAGWVKVVRDEHMLADVNGIIDVALEGNTQRATRAQDNPLTAPIRDVRQSHPRRGGQGELLPAALSFWAWQ
jgi:hypothetical protein